MGAQASARIRTCTYESARWTYQIEHCQLFHLFFGGQEICDDSAQSQIELDLVFMQPYNPREVIGGVRNKC